MAKKAQGRQGTNSESLLRETMGLLRRFGLKARKGLGQHFLINQDVLQLIVATAQLTPKDTVLEVGPGLGILTRELVKHAGQVLAIEVDSVLSILLRDTLAPFENLIIINEDILKLTPQALFQECFPGKESSSRRYKVVANLPYYIASPVMRHFLEASPQPEVMVVMVQKEVAEEIVAQPGRMSLLSVSVQLYGEPTLVGYVPAQSFYPEPEVDSAILKVTVYPQPRVEVDTESFFQLVRAGFTTPRKQIANSLAQGTGLAKSEVLPLLEKANIASQRRAETLSIEEWAHLWRVLNPEKG